MTRILYWNIENFNLPRVMGTPDADARANYISAIFNQNPPDIFVIVEVYSRTLEVGIEGGVINERGNPGQACLSLLRGLREQRLNERWCLVPPLNIGEGGYREAVAVFYNANVLRLAGPNLYYRVWDNEPFGQGQPVNAVTHGRLVDYPLQWQRCLPGPHNRELFPYPPDDPLFRPGLFGDFQIPECNLAAEWEYYPANGAPPRPTPVNFPPPNRLKFPYEGCRGPYRTNFQELAGQQRLLNIFAVHTSPSSARQAVLNMGNVPELNAVQPGQVNVILGDFNVDIFDRFQTYDWMLRLYTPALDPRAARKPYCMTHLLPVGDATPFTPYNNNGQLQADPQHNVYPRFGYMGSAFPYINDSGAIDNVFTAYANTARPAANNITVINTVTGTPYAGQQGLNYPPTLDHQFPQGIDPHYVHADLEKYIFQFYENFGVIADTSDHLPLIIDI